MASFSGGYHHHGDETIPFTTGSHKDGGGGWISFDDNTNVIISIHSPSFAQLADLGRRLTVFAEEKIKETMTSEKRLDNLLSGV